MVKQCSPAHNIFERVSKCYVEKQQPHDVSIPNIRLTVSATGLAFGSVHQANANQNQIACFYFSCNFSSKSNHHQSQAIVREEIQKNLRPVRIVGHQSMASSWRRSIGNVRSFIGNSMGGLRGGQSAASWVVAGTIAYFLWIKPEQDLKKEQELSLV
ncbi:hypothetical protein ISN44_As02g028360 [Arabidopsis suecica]|uniref:Subtilisin-like protease n=2 Tax=Arabidopsis TaxID=3701 RepID=A0A1P8B2W7_ARATH|nr:subtilisin-like protease [Arabidopsis thaliana]ANM63241.1 subtilisin-like protease [Arabidopsis thaliana]KAG7642984.1 hypothetical protein ISN44_As02g028360 [Arabidopsis suecica]|eukprot:NP_001325343.1 subtilisin-like protease [Arabidopsis thaliana]